MLPLVQPQVAQVPDGDLRTNLFTLASGSSDYVDAKFSSTGFTSSFFDGNAYDGRFGYPSNDKLANVMSPGLPAAPNDNAAGTHRALNLVYNTFSMVSERNKVT